MIMINIRHNARARSYWIEWQNSPWLVVWRQSARHLEPPVPGGGVLAVLLRDEAGAEHLLLLLICAEHCRLGLERSCTLQGSELSVVSDVTLKLIISYIYLLWTMLHLARSRLLFRDRVLRLLMVPESRDIVWHAEVAWPREPLRHVDWPQLSWHGCDCDGCLLCLLQQEGASGGLSSDKNVKYSSQQTHDDGHRWSPDKMAEGGGGRVSRSWSHDWAWCNRGRWDGSVSKLCDSSITRHKFVTQTQEILSFSWVNCNCVPPPSKRKVCLDYVWALL